MRVMAMAGCSGVIIVLLYLQLTVAVLGKETYPRQKLYTDLFKRYHKEVFPPVKKGPLNVNLHMNLVKVAEVNKPLGYIDLYVWLSHRWTDSRLSWDPKDYSNITETKVLPRQIWKPDITLYNNAGTTSGIFQGDEYRAVILSDGEIMWIPAARLKVFCSFGYGNTHTCVAKFGSWTYNGGSMNLTEDTGSISVDDYSTDPYIQIDNTSSVREEFEYACCPEPYVQIKYYIQFTIMSSATHLGPSYGLVIAILVALMNYSLVC